MRMVGMMNERKEETQTQVSLTVNDLVKNNQTILLSTYTLVRKPTFTARAVICGSSRVVGPHGKGGEEREDPAESNAQLYLPATGTVFVCQRELDGKQAVEVDEDKVVDGTTEEDHNAAGDQLAHEFPQRPSPFMERKQFF